MKEIDLLEIGGFTLGHAQNEEAATGCTVILCQGMAPAGLDVRGGGPASRESQILNPLMAAEGINALLLSGGSAFGLDAAGGVQRYLEEQGIGFDTGYAKVPLVSQSCLYDLGIGSATTRPDAAMAYAACRQATATGPAPQGNVGAGMGCTVGKLRGMQFAMKAGLGCYAVQLGELKVGALVAVNALGDICREGVPLAGLRGPDGTLLGSEAAFWQGASQPAPGGNTTLGVAITNAAFAKAQLCKLAAMAQDAYPRAIRPVHTSMDGDSVYALSTGTLAANLDLVGTLSVYVMERAIWNAAKMAEPSHGLPAAER
ncbi:MAG: P1 family peptidase [Gemmiger sp.]|nr:P1 family peptidase [Gemmiger sp.]